MHEAQLDGAMINVSIVLPRRKLSPAPPMARRGAGFDPRNPPPAVRSGPTGAAFGGGPGRGGRGRRLSPPAAGSTRYGPRSDTYRPRSLSRSRSRSPPPTVSNASRRHRLRSRSYSSRSRSRSKTPPGRGGRSMRGSRRTPSPAGYGGYDQRSRSRSRSRDWDRR